MQGGVLFQQVEIRLIAGELGQYPLQLLSLQDGALLVEVDLAANVHAELGSILEGLRQLDQFLLLGGGEIGIPRQEGKFVEIFGAIGQRGEQGEGGGDRLAQSVAQHIP